MFTALFLTGGAIWCLTYVLIIRVGFRDRTYGMPFLAVGANLSWEFLYGAIWGYPQGLRPAVAAWLCIDLFILYQILVFGPAEFPRLRRTHFYGAFTLSLLISLPLIITISQAFDDPWGVHAAYFIDITYGCMFLAMLYSRQSSRGQSVGIAIGKLTGTTLISVAFIFYPPMFGGSPLLKIMTLTAFILGVVYLVALLKVRANEKASVAAGLAHPRTTADTPATATHTTR